MGALVETRGLSKTYRMGDRSVDALRDVSLSISEGEFVAVVGPSGSGKSTLLNLLGCLDTPTGGTYRLAGEDVSGLDPDRLAAIRNARLGFVFQSFYLLPGLSALENVALPLIYAGVGLAERRRRAVEQLDRVGLADRRDHRPMQLSIGQQQRVAIARAMVNDPALVLADEPTGSLDRRTGTEIMAAFQRLHADGKTVLLITHDETVAARAKRRVTVLDGAIVDDRAVRSGAAEGSG